MEAPCGSGERPGDRRRGITGLLEDVVLSRRSQPLQSPSPSLKLSVGFAQAALTPQRDPRSRGESKGKPATNSKSDGSVYCILCPRVSTVLSLKSKAGSWIYLRQPYGVYLRQPYGVWLQRPGLCPTLLWLFLTLGAPGALVWHLYVEREAGERWEQVGARRGGLSWAQAKVHSKRKILSSPHSLMQHLPAPFFCHQLLAFLLPLHRVPGVLSQPPRVPLPLGFLPSPLSPVGGRGDRNSRPRALALAVSHPAEACVARLSVSASRRIWP
ncbi:hypothetical protein NDU88_008122 [Pleurodeles waltl]|uniref:Uncharacterized protein n=1 Tax=Pleurodeles waltl TaxID=8319 RepID=A0AAV7RUA0_PLEWA|nr:hypothetical protein NDU88_008122 [Pleurodeles waltl]